MAVEFIRFRRIGDNVWFMGSAYDAGNAIARRGDAPTRAETDIYVELRNGTDGPQFFAAVGTIAERDGRHYRIDVQRLNPIYSWAYQVGNETKAQVNSNLGLEHFEPPFAKPEIHSGLNGSMGNGNNWWIPVAMVPAKNFKSKTGKSIFGEQEGKHDNPGTLNQRGILKDRNGGRDTSHIKTIQDILGKAGKKAASDEGRFDESIMAELAAYIDASLEEVDVLPEEASSRSMSAAAAVAAAA